jgi:ATPase subunit of ABC transporter with duplicated ATPase domains
MKIEALSGGERARLKLLLLKIERPTLLILDEPTNHLDVDGIEQLEHALVENNTTCLFVSHDRRFVKNVATCMGVIENGVLRIELVTQL